jgi:RNA polymerase sigma factor (TIGR02999 family)
MRVWVAPDLNLEWPVSDTRAAQPSLPQLFESIYGRLKELSAMCMRSQPAGHTLQPTAVVHEAFVKLADRKSTDFKDEDHFLATAATVLRSVLVDHARRRRSKKRGGVAWKASVDEFQPMDPSVEVGGVLALEDALQQLAKNDARSAQVAELRIFGGLPMDQVARMLDVAVATAERDWRLARAWLEREYDLGLKSMVAEDAS